MQRSRGFGIAIMLLGLVFLARGTRVPTYSRVAMTAGVLFMIVGAVYSARNRRRVSA
jgi:hypothetical protein